MPDGSLGSIGSVSVDVTGDMTSLDKDLASLPAKLGQRIASAEQKIRAQMAANRSQLKPLGDDSAYRTVDDQKKYDALTASQSMLAAKLAAVEVAYKRMTAAKITDTSASDRASGATYRYAQSLRAADGGLGKVGQSGGNAAYGLLRLSQAVEDAQYGFSAIVNNIPGIVMSLGGGPGLAGAVSILAVGVNQLVSHWDLLKSTFDQTTPIGKAIKQVEDLAKSFGFASDEAAKLKKAEEDRKKATEEIHGIKDRGASDRGQGIGEAITAVGGGPKAVDALMNKLTQQGLKLDPKGMELARGQYSKLLSDAMKGEGTAIERLMKEARGTALGPKIDEFSPETKRKHEEFSRERDAAEAQSTINRQKAEDERERLAKRAADVAEQAGSRLNVDILTKGTDRGALKDLLQMRLEDTGTRKEEAAVIAHEAVEATASKFVEAMKAMVISGQAGSMDEARKALLKQENMRAGEESDARRMQMKEQIGQNFKQSYIGLAEYFNRLQSAGSQENAGVKAAQEANVKLDKIVENTKGLHRLATARYAKKMV